MNKKRILAIGLLVLLFCGYFVTGSKAHGNENHNTAANTAGAANSNSDDSAIPSEAKPATETAIAEFPNYHPLVVHFPIVLLIIAAFFQIASFVGYRKEFSLATLLLLLAGVASVYLASNVFHAHAMNLSARANAIFEEHELLAKYTLWLSVAALVVKALSHFLLSRKWWCEAAVVLLMVAAAVAVSIVGHHGAQLVHLEGIGPQGKFLESHQH